MKPLVSVLMPSYNSANTLDKALRSVLSQKADFEYEIVFVNDFSTDKTSTILKNYLNKNRQIVYFENKKNLGKGLSLKNAYEQSKGNYFIVLDSDDYFTDVNKLSIQVAALESNKDCAASTHDFAFKYKNNFYYSLNADLIPEKFNYKESFNNNFYFHTSTFLYRKITLELPKFFKKEIFSGDTPYYYYQLFTSKKGIVYSDIIGSVYVYNSEGIWTKLHPKQKKKTVEKTLKAIQKHVIGDKTCWEHQILTEKLHNLKESYFSDSNLFFDLNKISDPQLIEYLL